ncbi:MAG: hypothetical protein ACE5EF_01685 [Dehalococcoidia bacterium]
MRRTRHLPSLSSAVVLALGAVLALSGLFVVSTASASHDDNGTLGILRVREDSFFNWDFQHRGASVDWPVNILYWNNAEVDKIKIYYTMFAGWGGSTCGSTMWNRVNDGNGWVWDADDGIKTPCFPTCWASATHVRLYAPAATDRMYNTSWGYYVVATSHKDKNEFCPWGRRHGWSEDAEGYAVDTAKGFGWVVGHDWANFFNRLPEGYAGTHYRKNNGWASHVRVP